MENENVLREDNVCYFYCGIIMTKTLLKLEIIKTRMTLFIICNFIKEL